MINGNPCRWRGRVFPSQRAAARALGVDPSVIGRSLDRYGSIDHIEMRPREDTPRRTGAARPPAPRLEGRTQREIAEALGVTQATVSRHIAKYGHVRFIQPQGRRYREGRRGPYKLGRHVFSSRTAAADALGLCREKLRRWEKDPVKHGQDINIALAKYEKRTEKW